MNSLQFAQHTEKIKSSLPHWFEMRNGTSDSIGLQFLNIAGMELDDIESTLTYAYEQVDLNKIDIDFVDVTYKAIIPTIYEVDDIIGVVSNSASLMEVESLHKFFGLDYSQGVNNVIKTSDFYFFDRERKILYFRDELDKDNTYINGKVGITLLNNTTVDIPLTLHHVWNFMDEFGALLGCKRLYGEKNIDYKYRLLDVFVNPANSTKKGLANGIARELGIRRTKIWEDPKNEFIIKDKMVIANSITKNNEIVDLNNIKINAEGYLVIKSDQFETERDLVISYICGLEINSLANSKSNKFSNEIYNADGTVTDLLLSYVEKIKKNSAILWDDFLYDETMWVKDNDEFDINHFSFIPTKLDANIKGFLKYGYSKSNRQ